MTPIIPTHRTTIENEGWDDESSWLHGHARSSEGICGAVEGKKDVRRTMAISGPRITDSLDATKLAIGAKWTGTMNKTVSMP